ncbi:hypothetical protein B0T19DRAFT_476176 [Cercophora scortea]|uniref:F-box domain-containing protein n=1 Tax=Cercophora scortea TaxID=314031 RepID=A0AAE0IP66_9PEZI|nr:hypothetical protein B0T19DRAFT_476176 [Cercophora scortea]
MANLPVELVLEIAGRLPGSDLVNLSATNRGLHALLKTEFLKRLKASAKEGPGALFWACFQGHTDAVKAMLDGGADPNLGFSRLQPYFDAYLSSEDSPQTSSRLKEAFKRIATSNGDSSFGSADYFETEDLTGFCRRYPLENSWRPRRWGYAVIAMGPSSSYQEFFNEVLRGECRHLITIINTRSAEYDLCNCHVYFPLHLAVFRGHLDIVKLLVEKGVRLDLPSRNLNTNYVHRPGLRFPQIWHDSTKYPAEDAMITPLAVAIQCGHAEIARYLLQVETNELPNVALSSLCQPTSPLHFATVAGSPEITRQLFEVCLLDVASINQRNYQGLPPIWLAYIHENWEAVSALQDVGSNIDHDLANGFTPLTHALMYGYFIQAKRLLDMGARLDVTMVEAPKVQDLIRTIPGRGRGTDEPDYDARVQMENDKFQGLRGLEIACCSVVCVVGCLRKEQEEEFYSLFSASLRESQLNDTKTHSNEDPLPEVYAPISRFNLDQKNRGVTAPGIVTFLFPRQGHRYDNDSHVYESDAETHWRYSKRSKYLARLLRLGADPNATDNFGNNLVELALAQWDFDSLLVIAKYNNKAAETFSQHWTLGKFMSYFIDSKTRPGEQYWQVICRQGLQAFVSLGLATERSIATHPLLGRLVATLVREGFPPTSPDGEESIKYFLHLEGLPVGFVDELVDGETLLHHAFEFINTPNTRVSDWHNYMAQILYAGADANRPGRLGVLPIVKAVWPCPRVGVDPWLVDVLLEHGAQVHLEGPPEGAPANMGPRAYENFNPVLKAIHAARRIDEMESPTSEDRSPSADNNEVNDGVTLDYDQEEDDYLYRCEVLVLLLGAHPLFRGPRAPSAALQDRYLKEAIASGNCRSVEILVTYGADPNKRLEDGNTVLLWAIKMLVDLSFPRLGTKSTYTQGLRISEFGCLIKNLLHHGAGIHAKDRTGKKLSTLEYLRELFVVKRKRCWGERRESVRDRLIGRDVDLLVEDRGGLAVEGRRKSGRSWKTYRENVVGYYVGRR